MDGSEGLPVLSSVLKRPWIFCFFPVLREDLLDLWALKPKLVEQI